MIPLAKREKKKRKRGGRGRWGHQKQKSHESRSRNRPAPPKITRHRGGRKTKYAQKVERGWMSCAKGCKPTKGKKRGETRGPKLANPTSSVTKCWRENDKVTWLWNWPNKCRVRVAVTREIKKGGVRSKKKKREGGCGLKKTQGEDNRR